LEQIVRPPPPALGHSGNRKQAVGFVVITYVDAKDIANGEIVIGPLDYADLVSGSDITLDDQS
jgi:hypothetical protein